MIKQIFVKLKQERYQALVAKGVGAVIAFLTQLLIVKLVGQEVYGQYAYYLGWINLIAIIALFGYTDTIIKYTSTYLVSREESVGAFFNFVMVFLLVTGVAGALLFILAGEFLDTNITVSPWVTLLMLPCLVLFSAFQSLLRGIGKGVQSITVNQIYRPLIMLSLLGFFAFNTKIYSAELVALCLLTAYALLVLVGAFISWKATHGSDILRTIRCSFKLEWLTFSRSLFWVSISNEVMRRGDLIVIGIFLGAKEVAIYAVIQSFGNIMLFSLQALNSFTVGSISRLWEKQQTEELQRLLSGNARIIAIISVISFCLFAALGNQILALYGDTFTAGFYAFVIYMGAQLVNALSGPVGYLMSMTGNQVASSRVFMLGSVLNLVLNFILVPVLGLLGAAVASFIAIVFWNLVLLHLVRKRTGMNPSLFMISPLLKG